MDLLPGVNHSQLLRLATRMVGLDDAEDVVQNAYIRALRHAGQFREEARRQTWVYRIVQRCALDHLRAQRRRPEVELHAHQTRATAPVRVTLAGEWARRLTKVSEHERSVLAAAAEYDTTAEAAGALGLSCSAFKSTLHRARRAL
jgi:RNA polymerase sigma-70 factor, ECF subfamily